MISCHSPTLCNAHVIQLLNLLDGLNLMRFVNDATVAYFYPDSGQTTAVIFLEVDRQSLTEASQTITSFSKKISDSLSQLNRCDGLSLLQISAKRELFPIDLLAFTNITKTELKNASFETPELFIRIQIR
ncbi:hypothetical protein FBUS_00530 [Fasciolopsis buskii]|uniref:Uncharacterized protein n=1 Tax=Fasciolopsis buskii TaxID=27845 RepID=A0A8E0S6H4_9TREM|nr:hypothetical protein FBUS_00530 [Fasciolopsis buski]